ncbi:hypothetical protein Tco_0099303 [Tanacetum coccineum]
MTDLAFVQQHNMVAYLEKNDGNADFYQILDFLTFSSINFALTVSPTIYASYIEQFWNTASLKIINSEKQIHAKVNGKAVVVSESSVRRDLHLNDEDGTACLTVNEIFENLALMGYEIASDKLTFYKEILTQIATATASQPPKDPNTYRRTKRGRNTKVPQSGGSPKKVGDEAINEAMGAPAQTRSERVLEQPIEPPFSEGHTSGSGEGRMEHQFELTANVPITPHDSPLPGGYKPGSDEGRLKLQGIVSMWTKLSKHVLEYGKEKYAQARGDPQTIRIERMHPIWGGINDKTNPCFMKVTFDGFLMMEDVTMTMAQTLIKMKEEKAKEKGVAFKDDEDSSRPVRLITTLQPFPSIDPKDKGKGILVEGEHVKVKRKDQGLAQIESDARVAHRPYMRENG